MGVSGLGKGVAVTAGKKRRPRVLFPACRPPPPLSPRPIYRSLLHLFPYIPTKRIVFLPNPFPQDTKKRQKSIVLFVSDRWGAVSKGAEWWGAES